MRKGPARKIVVKGTGCFGGMAASHASGSDHPRHGGNSGADSAPSTITTTTESIGSKGAGRVTTSTTASARCVRQYHPADLSDVLNELGRMADEQGVFLCGEAHYTMPDGAVAEVKMGPLYGASLVTEICTRSTKRGRISCVRGKQAERVSVLTVAAADQMIGFTEARSMMETLGGRPGPYIEHITRIYVLGATRVFVLYYPALPPYVVIDAEDKHAHDRTATAVHLYSCTAAMSPPKLYESYYGISREELPSRNKHSVLTLATVGALAMHVQRNSEVFMREHEAGWALLEQILS